MMPLTEIIDHSGNANRVLSAQYLKHLVGGSDARRYGLVNRALKSGELLRIRRGQYVLADRFRTDPVHPFALAQQMAPGSFISAESALSFHGWIPEAVQTVVSMVHGGKSKRILHEVFGQFAFHRMTVKPGYFFQNVTRHKLQHQVASIAEPERALLDLVYLRKTPWQGLGFLLEGLRIDEESINDLPVSRISKLLKVYQGQREQQFIQEMTTALQQ